MRNVFIGGARLSRVATCLATLLVAIQTLPLLLGTPRPASGACPVVTCTCPPGAQERAACCCARRTDSSPRPPADLTPAEQTLWTLAWEGVEPCQPAAWRQLTAPEIGSLTQSGCAGGAPELDRVDGPATPRLAPPPTLLALAPPLATRWPPPGDQRPPGSLSEVPQPVPLPAAALA